MSKSFIQYSIFETSTIELCLIGLNLLKLKEVSQFTKNFEREVSNIKSVPIPNRVFQKSSKLLSILLDSVSFAMMGYKTH